jgi:hypothetical protein
MRISCVLVSEGPSDLCLQRITQLLVHDLFPNIEIEFLPGDGAIIRNPPGPVFAWIRNAYQQFNPSLILVHRDSDNEGPANRRAEIDAALFDLRLPSTTKAARVVPVRKTEAWLLADKQAILRVLKQTQFDPRVVESFPAFKNIEDIEAKARLKKILEESRIFNGARRKDINFSNDRQLLGREINDLASLRKLPSFQAFEEDLQNAINTLTS